MPSLRDWKTRRSRETNKAPGHLRSPPTRAAASSAHCWLPGKQAPINSSVWPRETYFADLLSGTYDCVDRISLRGYYPLGQTSGGLLTWWNQLYPGVPLTAQWLRRMAGDFGRRVNAYAHKHGIPIQYCELGDKTKHARAEKLRPQDPNFQGVFLVFVAKAPALVYDKGDRVLRVEVIVNNIEELRCGKRLEKLPGMLARLQQMIVEFLGVVQAAHLSFLDGGQLDALAAPTVRGEKRVAGVDLQKPRMPALAEVVVALAASPGGFTAKELAARVRAQQGRSMAGIIHPLDAHYQKLQREMLATLQTLKLAA